MKRAKKLTYQHKQMLSKKGFDPGDFRYVTEDKTATLFVNTKTNERVWIKKI